MMYNFFKLLFDYIFSFLGIIILSPVFFIIAIAIKFDSKGPVFYRSKRIGQYSKEFKVFKFRTMVDNAEKLGGPSTAYDDPRFTKIGKFLRRYKLDELPQLFNILKGEMSFVGPRPQVEEYTSKYSEEEKKILAVKPGLTDYASIEYINLDRILGNENVDEVYKREIEPKKNELRLMYIRNRSFVTDAKILFYTILKIFKLPALWR